MATAELPGALQAVEPLVKSYGYFAVGGLIILEDFGLPVPGETVLVAAAVLAGAGELNVYALAAVAIVCAVIGDNIGFAIGHFGGENLLKKYGKYLFMTEEKIKTTRKFFDRFGPIVVVVARFIEGLRQLNGIIAGTYNMKWHKFLLFNFIGAAIWSVFWVGIGNLAGNNIGSIYKTVTSYGVYGAIAIIVLLTGWFGFRYFRKRARNKA